jgi:hypothetical protein
MLDKFSPNVKAAILSAVVAVSLALIGAAYKIGYDSGTKDYDTVVKFRDALPDMMTNLGKLAKELNVSTETVEANRRLTQEAASATQEIQRLQSVNKDQAEVLRTQQTKIGNLESQVASLFPGEELKVSVMVGSAERVIPNFLTIGVPEIYGNNSFISIRMSGEQAMMNVGEKRTIKGNGGACAVELVKIDKPKTDFVVTCSKGATTR